MSIKWLNAVWTHSRHKGSPLLLLLAIADVADETGKAHPGRAYLSRRTRLSEQYVREVTEYLITKKPQELKLLHRGGSGPGDPHVYQITLRPDASKPDKGRPASPPEPPDDKGRPASPIQRIRDGKGKYKGRRAYQEPLRTSLDPIDPLKTTTTSGKRKRQDRGSAGEAAAAVVANEWNADGLMIAGGLGVRGLEPSRYLARYLYAMCQRTIKSPTLYAAKTHKSPTAAPWSDLGAMSPREVAAVLRWLLSGDGYPDNPLALVLRSYVSGAADRDRIARAIYELGLADTVAQLDQERADQREDAAPDDRPTPPLPAVARTADEWTRAVSSVLKVLPHAATQLELTRLQAAAVGRITVSAPHRGVIDWLENRLGRRLREALAVETGRPTEIEWRVEG